MSVTAPTGCAWSATSHDAWITVTSGSPGSGGGSVGYSVAVNTSTNLRTGTATIAGQTFTVTQSGVACTYSINPTNASFPASGGTASVDVTAPSGCAWAATSNDAWITVTSGSSGSGGGSVNYSVASNPSTSVRTGTITIGGQTFTVNQGGATCSYSINPGGQNAPAGGGSWIVNVMATPADCSWSAVTNDAWITITGGSPGVGNGWVGFTVAANVSTVARTGTMTIAGNVFTVNQAGAAGVPNDEIAGALLVAALPYSTTQNTVAATSSAADPLHSCGSGTQDSNTVWYRYIATFNGSLRVDTAASDYDTVLTAYAGTSAVGPELACNDDVNGTLQSEITFGVTSGQSYLIEASDYNTAPGGGTLVLHFARVGGSVPGDFDGNGKTDVIWQNDASGQASVWLLGGVDGLETVDFGWLLAGGDPVWRVAGTADFNNDGHPDVIWCNESTGQAAVWFMGGANGLTMQSFGWIHATGDPSWRIVGAADFDGNGQPDAIWRHLTTGQAAVWFLGGADGLTPQGFGWINAVGDPFWRIVGTADFDVNGQPDVIWRHVSNGQAAVWFMGGADGLTPQGFGWINAAVDPNWRVVGSADFDGDGKADVVWQQLTTRQTAVWFMTGANGLTLQRFAWLHATGAPGWSVIPAQ